MPVARRQRLNVRPVPENTRHCCFNVARRLRRRLNIRTTLGQRVVFSGVLLASLYRVFCLQEDVRTSGVDHTRHVLISSMSRVLYGARVRGYIRVLLQQTRKMYPVFDQCWTNVVDVEPTLVKHRVDVSCLLGKSVLSQQPKTLALTQCRFKVGPPP